MASIRHEVTIEAAADTVWDAVRDVGAIHTRLAPDFVTDTKLEPGARLVTFANGMTAKELIVDVDDAGRRLVWSVVESPRLTHHNASMQIFADGPGRCRAVWIADILPSELAGFMRGMIEQGMNAMKKHLERP
jgi:hypothetical protein